jgi:hypothetical protein
MTGETFRALALAMQGAIEGAHMGHPDFRANGRIFASLDAAERSATVMLAPDEQAELVRSYPGTFVPAAGAWGRQGCTTLVLRQAAEAAVRGAIVLAWQRAVDRPRRKAPPERRRR